MGETGSVMDCWSRFTGHAPPLFTRCC